MAGLALSVPRLLSQSRLGCGVLAELSKVRLSSLVVVSSVAGYGLAATIYNGCSMGGLGHVCLGTFLCAASANTLNQCMEVDYDKLMHRTCARPLPSKRISLPTATYLATGMGLSGTAYLYLMCDPTTALLGAGNIILYSYFYTVSKRRSVYNTQLGAFVGAIPPMMGYVAGATSLCSGLMAPGLIWPCDAPIAFVAFYLFLWQSPHFYALSYKLREDYGRAGYKMVACGPHGAEHSKLLITAFSAFLTALPIASLFVPSLHTDMLFVATATPIHLAGLLLARRFSEDGTDGSAWSVFLFSLSSLPLVLVLYILCTWRNRRTAVREAHAWEQFQLHQVHEALALAHAVQSLEEVTAVPTFAL